MSLQNEDIICAIRKAIPMLPEGDRQFLLGYAEGVAAVASQQKERSDFGDSPPPPALPPAG